MSHQNMKVFLTVVEQQSLSGAARALNYTQPTISSYLTQLEKHLDVQLIRRERGARKIVLTPAGAAFVPLAQKQMELDAQIDLFVKNQKQSQLRLAASAYAHQSLVPFVVSSMMQKNAGNRTAAQIGYKRRPV